MIVKLKHHTPLEICSYAIRTCWQSHDKSDNGGDKDKELIDRIGNKYKHSSTLEHLIYSFTIEGISRACLQELARHRLASPSVKSTRYTLKELKDIDLFINSEFDGSYDGINWDVAERFLVMTPDEQTNINTVYALYNVQLRLRSGISNDYAKFGLPENFKTDLSWTINARSLQNFITLRSSSSALWEIQNLANALYEEIPDDHKFIFESGILRHIDNY